MKSFRCLQKGHPVSYCTNIIKITKSDKRSDGGKSKSSKSISSTKTSKAESIMKPRNSQIKMKK